MTDPANAPEHWDEDDPETTMTECQRCGERRPCQLVIDPFVVEGISEGPDVKEWWCWPCFELRSDDI